MSFITYNICCAGLGTGCHDRHDPHRKLAEWLERDYPLAAAPVFLEGLEECFMINRSRRSQTLPRCLATINIIESLHAAWLPLRTGSKRTWAILTPANWEAILSESQSVNRQAA